MGEKTGIKSIPFRDLPMVPRLVSDILDSSCPLDFGFPIKVDVEAWRRRSREAANARHSGRFLVERLLARSEGLDTHPAQRKNIKALAEPGTLVVVTGQQVGIGGGPLLTLYKALTTIAIAREMEKKSGVRTIPLFWMATADHNLDEAAQIHWIDQENRLSGISSSSGSHNRVPVGNLQLGAYAEELLEKLSAELPESEFKPALMEHLAASYRPEETFGRAFHRLGNRVLGRYGMVMLDPEDEELKRASRPFWVRAVEDVDERLECLRSTSRRIRDAGYDVQVQVTRGRPALFVLEDGIRRKVVLEGRTQRALSDMIISRSDLLELAKNHPERLSAGVTLRPLYQGYLLPVGAYVAGPHEFAYWAQLADVFGPMGIARPTVIHRAAMTLIEKKTKRRLEKVGVGPEAFFGDLEDLTEKLLQERSDGSVRELFREIHEQGRTCLKELNDHAVGPYAGLETAILNAFKKIHYQLDKLENSFNRRARQQHAGLLRNLEILSVHLRPAGKLQERVISPLYYYSRYGFIIFDKLLEISSHYRDGHLLVDMEELLS